MKLIRRLVLLILGGIAVLLVILVVRTLTISSIQPVVEPAEPLPIDVSAAAGRLSESIRIKTVSFEDPKAVDRGEFLRLLDYLEKKYPRVHSTLERTVINELSPVYTWRGRDSSAAPILLTGHLDVVPAEAADWSHPPFTGVIDGGFVWGRGTMDDKVGVLGILEAAEYLLGTGFTPERTICFAFGCDEEIDGVRGAQAIADHFEKEGTHFCCVLDEGLMVVDGLLPGLDPPAAVVGIAEKGYVNVELAVHTEGGHSSIPPPETAVGVLSGAVAKLERNPMPTRLKGAVEEMLHFVAPEMNFPLKLLMGNLWITEPLVEMALASTPATNAAVRTTAAPTMLKASYKANVLASRASAIVNYRLLPGDTIDSVLEHVRSVVDDPRVEVGLGPGVPSEPSRVSSVDCEEFRWIAESLRAVFPEAVVAPTLGIAATDARHYERVGDQVYRHLPIPVTADDLARFHGVDERIAVDAYGKVITFYAHLMVRAAGAEK